MIKKYVKLNKNLQINTFQLSVNISSFDAEISHHLIILMFENMAMPNIPSSCNVEGEWLS
jgi:hypothetical protein